MLAKNVRQCSRLVTWVPLVLAVLASSLLAPAASADFVEDLARVDKALKENPSHVLEYALESCLHRRKFAIVLWESGHEVRANRALKACFHLLDIPEEAPAPKVTAPTREELEQRAVREIEKALALEPDVARGLEIYRECAACHMPEGFGLSNGSVPQIAGQHRVVLIKQLADIRAGYRDAVLMAPYASVESIGGAQAVADVTAYIDTLEISVDTGKGSGKDLELGEKLYAENCVRCHGPHGEGNPELFAPRIQSQHYNYLVRQFQWIRDGNRRNGNPDMVKQIQSFGDRETAAVLDYVSRLQPPPELQAPPGWQNPDFVKK
jgi:cytochrome c553